MTDTTEETLSAGSFAFEGDVIPNEPPTAVDDPLGDGAALIGAALMTDEDSSTGIAEALPVANDSDPGFNPLPRRWVIERTFAWPGRNRTAFQFLRVSVSSMGKRSVIGSR